MNIYSISEIKNDSIILYYKIPTNEEYSLWVGSEEDANVVEELITSTYFNQEGFYIYRGLFTNQEKTDHYLFLVEDDNGIRMYDGTWSEAVAFRKQELKEGALSCTIIPLFEFKNTQEEVIIMTQQPTKVLTGSTIITTAKSGELFKTLSKPVVVIKRDEHGILIYNDSKEVVVIDNKFLSEVFVPYVEKEEVKREYLTLQQALEVFTNDEHVHADVFLPSGEVNESVCLNQFLPIAQMLREVSEEEGALGTLKFVSEFKRATENLDEDAMELLNPLNACIPVEILLYGKFFVESKAEEGLFNQFN